MRRKGFRSMMRSSRKQDSFWKRALGIASANFFTARYLTPLAKSGYIAVAGGEKNRYLPGKQYRILRILPHHYGLVRPRSPQVVLRGRSF